MDTIHKSQRAIASFSRSHHFPIDLHPTAQQAEAFAHWGRVTRQVHTCVAMMVLQGLQGETPDARACWSAAQAGVLPSGLTIPDPEMVLTAPGCLRQKVWDRDFPGLKSQLLQRAMQTLAEDIPADLPYGVIDRVVDAVYAPLAQPRGGHRAQVAYGQRSYREVLQVPGPLDPLIIPIPEVILSHSVQMSIPHAPGFDVLAEIFSLPLNSWTPGQQVPGELHFVGGRWRLWVTLPLPLRFAPPTQGGVGVDPGIRNWLSCADDQGRSFTLSGPGEVLQDRFTQRAEAFESIRPAFEQALAQLMPYRLIALEGTSWTGASWAGGRTSLERMQAAALPQMYEWLAAYARGHGGREVLLAPANSSSRVCSGCHGPGQRTRGGTWFVCSGCGLELDRDVNGARNHLWRAQRWPRRFRHHPIRYSRDWWRSAYPSPVPEGPPLPFASPQPT